MIAELVKPVEYYQEVFRPYQETIEPEVIAPGIAIVRDVIARAGSQTMYDLLDLVAVPGEMQDRLSHLCLISAETNEEKRARALDQTRAFVVTYATQREAWDQTLDRLGY